MPERISRNTIIMSEPPTIYSYSSTVGEKEGDGPLGKYFDEVSNDAYFGQKTWEKAESELMRRTAVRAIGKGGLSPADIDLVLAGDLQNQCAASTFALRELGIPILGLYGACSTMSESLLLGAVFTDSGAGGNILCVTSSHFSTAERQFRFPLSYGGVRTPTAQWTCTASGAAVLSAKTRPPYIKGVSVGKIVDMGVCDSSNMGAAMAPAAAYVISAYLNDTKLSPSDFDCIVTGDLGKVGSSLLVDLMKKDGTDISGCHYDCGAMIFDSEEQDTRSGGSGCGCSGAVLCGYFLDRVKSGRIKNILFCATGALMSVTASQQGESIPAVSHAVHISFDAAPLRGKE